MTEAPTISTHVLDLGEAWKRHTGLPFVYAAWLARADAPGPALVNALTRAKAWGVARLDALAETWAARLALPLDRVQDYFQRVMQYGLDEDHLQGLRTFQAKCLVHGLIETAFGLQPICETP